MLNNYESRSIFYSWKDWLPNEIIHGGVQQIDLSKQAKGIYFVKLMHKGITEQRKLVVQ